MKMSDADVRDRVLTLFAECRQAPDAPFDEDRFIDHLIEPPAQHGEIRDSFASNRRYARFVNKVQAEFSVYFSMQDWETNFNLDGFVERILYLRDKPAGSLRSLQNAMTQTGTNAAVVANVLLVSFALMSWNIKWLFTVFAALWVGVNGWMAWFFRRERQYQKSLLRQIENLRGGRGDRQRLQ